LAAALGGQELDFSAVVKVYEAALGTTSLREAAADLGPSEGDG
jgi:hypothetical protein